MYELPDPALAIMVHRDVKINCIAAMAPVEVPVVVKVMKSELPEDGVAMGATAPVAAVVSRGAP